MNCKRILLVCCALFILCGLANASESKSAGVPASEALTMLKEGAHRFTSGTSAYPHQDSDRIKEVVAGQHPYATILSCSDSRVPVEMIFDAGFGDLFVVRVAGNVASPEQVGTIEYGLEHLGSNLIVVMGHSKCGAVTAACSGGHAEGAVNSILEKIAPATLKCKAEKPALQGNELVSAAIHENVWCVIEDLMKSSPVIRERVKNGSLQICGAVYQLENTGIEWMGYHPKQKQLVELTSKYEAKGKEHVSAPSVEHKAAPTASANIETQLAELTETVNQLKQWVDSQNRKVGRNQPKVAVEEAGGKH